MECKNNIDEKLRQFIVCDSLSAIIISKENMFVMFHRIFLK
jgi:hypothetical protein